MDQVPSRTEKIKDGETIVEEGTWAFYAYILKSGRAKVLKNIDDRPVLIRTLSKGDVFGEISFLGGVKRTASVIADGDVEVEMISKDAFMDALDQLPQDARSRLNTLLSDLTGVTEVNGRLMALLDELQKMRAKTIDLGSFEREVEKMPELLHRMVIALVQRLNASVESCATLAAQAEEAVKAIELLVLPSET
jgi:CRP-like cAMP-binding protein